MEPGVGLGWREVGRPALFFFFFFFFSLASLESCVDVPVRVFFLHLCARLC